MKLQRKNKMVLKQKDHNPDNVFCTKQIINKNNGQQTY